MLGYHSLTMHQLLQEAKVVKSLSDKGIRKDLNRKKFLEHAWKWKEHHGGIILEQLKKLGASCDWEELSSPWTMI